MGWFLFAFLFAIHENDVCFVFIGFKSQVFSCSFWTEFFNFYLISLPNFVRYYIFFVTSKQTNMNFTIACDLNSSCQSLIIKKKKKLYAMLAMFYRNVLRNEWLRYKRPCTGFTMLRVFFSCNYLFRCVRAAILPSVV